MNRASKNSRANQILIPFVGGLTGRAAACLCVLGLWTGEAVAQSDLQPEQRVPNATSTADEPELTSFLAGTDLELRFVPGVYLPRLGGSTQFDGRGFDVGPKLDLEEDLQLGDTEPTFVGELMLRKADGYTLRASGFSFSAESGGRFRPNNPPGTNFRFGDVRLRSGDRFESSFDLSTFEGELAFKPLWTNRVAGQTDMTGGPVDFRIAPIVGIRVVDVSHRVAELGPGGAASEVDQTYLAPTLGGQLELDWTPGEIEADRWLNRVTINIATSLGPVIGADSGGIWSVRAGIHVLFTPQVGVLFGYRLVELDVRDDGYELDGGVQGLFVAASLRF